MKEMILETKRLLLRELKQDDFDDICKLLQDPIVMYAYEGAFSKKEVQEWLDKQLRRYQNDGFGLSVNVVSPIKNSMINRFRRSVICLGRNTGIKVMLPRPP